MILALQRLDQDGKEAVLQIIMATTKRVYWLHDAIQKAITQQLQDQKAMDAWIEREASIDAARHGDPYACSKTGDSTYWVSA